MALVIYECDTCKRKIEKRRNEQGLDVINNCIITDGCKGNLRLQTVKLAHDMPSPTPVAEGLDDWAQRKVLHTHNQQILSNKWRVVHNLDTKPNINVYVYQGQTGDLIEIQPRSINLINENVTEIILNQPYTGIAQAISRSSSQGQKVKTFTSDELEQGVYFTLSANNELTIATRYDDNNSVDDYVDITFTFLNPSTFKETTISPLRFSNLNVSSTWSDGNKIAINGELFKLRSQVINTNELINLKIQNASPFFISDISYGPSSVSLQKNEVFFMLTNPPFQIFDKILSQTLDASVLIKDDAPNQTSLINYQPNVLDTAFRHVFPYIDVIT